jgi:hypothetical protein
MDFIFRAHLHGRGTIMATLMEEPQVNQANLADWQTLIWKTSFEVGGFMAIGLTNMNNTSASR